MKTLGQLCSPNDHDFIKKTLARMDEQDRSNGVFSTKLFAVLDNTDSIKSEVRARPRQIGLAEESTMSAKLRSGQDTSGCLRQPCPAERRTSLSGWFLARIGSVQRDAREHYVFERIAGHDFIGHYIGDLA
jgi:hypothetical protein